MRGPMKDVVEAKWESASCYLGQKKGWGSQVRWECKLACGHVTTRYDKSGRLIKPKRARCEKCGDATRNTPGDSRYR